MRQAIKDYNDFGSDENSQLFRVKFKKNCQETSFYLEKLIGTRV